MNGNAAIIDLRKYRRDSAKSILECRKVAEYLDGPKAGDRLHAKYWRVSGLSFEKLVNSLHVIMQLKSQDKITIRSGPLVENLIYGISGLLHDSPCNFTGGEHDWRRMWDEDKIGKPCCDAEIFVCDECKVYYPDYTP